MYSTATRQASKVFDDDSDEDTQKLDDNITRLDTRSLRERDNTIFSGSKGFKRQIKNVSVYTKESDAESVD